jgi:DNA-binding LytR/AlgR family response regulator
MSELVFRHAGKWDLVPQKEILYLESCNKLSKVVTVHREYFLSTPLQVLAEHLPADQFIKIHRRYIVSKLHIRAIGNAYILIADKELPISRQGRSELRDKYRMFV